MPASNRRPLLDGVDAPPAPDISKAQDEALALHTQFETPAAAPTAVQLPSFKQPCTLKGAASALYAGALGYFLGVVPAAIKYKARQWGMIHSQGLASAQQLAVMSGVYTAVHCICQRIRMVEDGWNRGIAGCSTGLVLGWNNGPWSALQSCAGVGLISALIDLGGGVEAAEARVLPPLQRSHQQQHQTYSNQQHQPRPHAWQQQEPQQQQGNALAGLPQPVQLLALVLGASPSSMNSAAGSTASSSTADAPADKQPVHLPHGSSASKQQLHPGPHPIVEGLPGRAEQQQRQHQHGSFHHYHQQQQQSLVPAALLGHPAALAVKQLLAAPPLMFLGACCHPSIAPAVAASDVDGCPVVAAASAGRAVGGRRQ